MALPISPLPSLSESGSDDIYTMEKIMDCRYMDGVLKYEIKWLNYPSEQNTWEPESNILDKQALEEYKTLKATQKKGQKSRLDKLVAERKKAKEFQSKAEQKKKFAMCDSDSSSEASFLKLSERKKPKTPAESANRENVKKSTTHSKKSLKNEFKTGSSNVKGGGTDAKRKNSWKKVSGVRSTLMTKCSTTSLVGKVDKDSSSGQKNSGTEKRASGTKTKQDFSSMKKTLVTIPNGKKCEFVVGFGSDVHDGEVLVKWAGNYGPDVLAAVDFLPYGVVRKLFPQQLIKFYASCVVIIHSDEEDGPKVTKIEPDSRSSSSAEDKE